MSEDVPFPTVTVTDSGFTLSGGYREATAVRWSDVVEIVAYKFDAWTYDVICLGFRLDGSDSYIEVAKHCLGYKSFLKAVETKFPLKKGWWSQVVSPPFATNWMTIWGSSPPTQDDEHTTSRG